jgi:hypothetical protein
MMWCFVEGFGGLPGDKTYIFRLGPFGLGQELVSKRALFILLDGSWLFFGACWRKCTWKALRMRKTRS